jgi:bifunctional non-homologous end joining protein LigD
VGAVGTGFDQAQLRAIRGALDEMQRPDSPFHPDESLPPRARWVEPLLVAVVGLHGWTSVGRLRQPRFLGLAADPPDAVTWGAEGPGAGTSPQ